MNRISKVLLGILFLASAGQYVVAEQMSKNFNPDNAVQQMQQHWEKVVRENDPQKRQDLIREHREMMSEIQNNAGIERFHMGMMHGDTDNHMGGNHMNDLINTMEMHHMQMDMMEQ